MPYGLTPEPITSLQSVFESQPQIKSVIIYGSRAKGNYNPGSDIDFALKGEALTSGIL